MSATSRTPLAAIAQPTRAHSKRFERLNLLKRLNLSVQPALVTRSLVLVHQAFSGHAVEYRNCCCVGFRRSSFVTAADGCHNSLHMSSHHRPHTGVAGASCFCLTSTFFRLGGVRQVVLLGKLKEKLEIQPNSIVRAHSIVNQTVGVSASKSASGVTPAVAS